MQPICWTPSWLTSSRPGDRTATPYGVKLTLTTRSFRHVSGTGKSNHGPPNVGEGQADSINRVNLANVHHGDLSAELLT